MWPRADRYAVAQTIAAHARATPSEKAFNADLQLLQKMLRMEEMGGARYAVVAAAASIVTVPTGTSGQKTSSAWKAAIRAFIQENAAAETEPRWKTAIEALIKR